MRLSQCLQHNFRPLLILNDVQYVLPLLCWKTGSKYDLQTNNNMTDFSGQSLDLRLTDFD